jgi:ornithine--oxo-acid transaminase
MTNKSHMELENRFGAENYLPLPVVLDRGEGAWLWDVDGNKYLDMMSAYSAVSHGHSHPRLVRALKEQAGKLAIVSRAFHAEPLGPFLEKLCAITGLDKALPMNTGAEAVETAIKAARRWGYRVKGIAADKAEIIVADGNFHGRTTTIVGFSTEDEYKADFGPFAPGFVSVPFGDIDAMRAAMGPNTAAVMVEPLQGEAGIIEPPAGWLKDLRNLCTEQNVLLILDEIQTGLGRTGKLFAHNYEGITPDGLILGKALGGGLLPVSAFVSTDEVMAMFGPGSHGSTFGGNPLGAAVGLEALKVLEEEALTDRSAKLGKTLKRAMQGINSPLICDVRGKGLWIGVEIDPKYCAARTVCERLMARGILSKETHDTVVRLAPPLIISEEALNWAIDEFRAVIGELEGECIPAQAAVR